MTGNPSPTQPTNDLRGIGVFRGASRFSGLTRGRAPFYLIVPLAFGLLALALSPLHRYLTFTVEGDFPRYAGHALSLDQVLVWDPFVPCGYPFLLWALTRLGLSVFSAGKVLAGLSALAFLGLVYPLARIFLPRGASVLAQILGAVNWHLAQYGILCGTDLPWAAVQLAGFILLLRALARPGLLLAFLAGAVTGFAFDLRYHTLIALPWMALVLALSDARAPARGRAGIRVWLLLLGFFLAASPQLAVNLSQPHALFATGQVKNVWMGIYGQGNWTRHWQQAEQQQSLLGLIQADPARFFTHWVKEAVVFTLRLPLLALGIQPALIFLEPGPHLRLPFAIILGLFGLTLVLGLAWKPFPARRPSSPALFLLGYLALYGAAVSMAFTQFRFLLPLVPLGALALAGLIHRFQASGSRSGWLAPLSLVLAMAFLSGWGFYVTLERFQCRVREVQAAIAQSPAAGEIRVLSNRADLYAFHLPYHWISLPAEVQTPEELKAFAFSSRINYFLFEEAHRRSKEPENWPELKKWALEQETVYSRERYPALVLINLSRG